MSVTAFPLCWPVGIPRRKGSPEQGSFTGKQNQVMEELIAEIDRVVLGSVARNRTMRDYIIISTDIPVRRDGLPYANTAEPKDSGVAVYFDRKGKAQCFACDKYDKVWKNMRAIQRTIEALRGIERWGSSEMLDRAFTGFAALPAPGAPKPWHEVMGLSPDAGPVEIKATFRELAKTRHPDTGGSHAAFTELVEACDIGLKSHQ